MKDWLKHPFVLNFKKGLLDIKTALQEGNVKLFLKQLAVIGVGIWLVHWSCGKFQQQISRNQEQIRSIETQQRSEEDYMKNKQLLLALEPRFPDIAEKNNWLTSKILELYKEASLPPQLDGNTDENATNATFVLMSQGVSTKAGYMQLGKFLERIENEPSYLRVSEVTVTKEPTDLGNNKVTIRFHTIFPKQKIGATLFSNYKELIEKQGGKQVSLDSIPNAPIASVTAEGPSGDDGLAAEGEEVGLE